MTVCMLVLLAAAFSCSVRRWPGAWHRLAARVRTGLLAPWIPGLLVRCARGWTIGRRSGADRRRG